MNRKLIVVALLFIAGLFALLLLPDIATATIPPKEGRQFPSEFLQRLKANPRAFTYGKAYLGMVKRIRENIKKVADGQMRLQDLAASGGTRVSGTKSFPALLAEFQNTAAVPYPATNLQKELFDGPWPTGTLKQYYSENSYGAFSMTGTVYNWVRVSKNDTYYEGTQNGVGNDSKVGELLKEVLDLNDASIDFGQYDNDGPDGIPNSGDDDGFVDFVAFVHPESGGECHPTNIWSHQWSYSGWNGSAYTTNDPKRGGGFIQIDDYVILPGLACDQTTMIEIGVFCHEIGHAFGLPDLYDTDGSSEGVGHWCLMGSGSWNTPSSPAHLSPWCKIQLGWVTPTSIISNADATVIADVETHPVVYQLHDQLPEGQYFLVENRQKVGFDRDLVGPGLMIWHIDENVINATLATNTVNANELHPGVAVEPADVVMSGRGDAGDPFPGTSNKREFSKTTLPNSMPYGDLGTMLTSKVSVTNISDSQNPMTANLHVTPMLDTLVTLLLVAIVGCLLIWMIQRKRLVGNL